MSECTLANMTNAEILLLFLIEVVYKKTHYDPCRAACKITIGQCSGN